MRFHTQTAGVSLTAQQPEINIVRVAIQALAAVLGGTQSLHTNSMDEALALPSEHAATIALRTQQIIAEESGVANTIDPLAGSYFLEASTRRIEAQAYDYFRRIDELGGVLPAIEKGFFQSEISDAAYRYQCEIDDGIRHIVGVNAYAEDKPLAIPLLEMDPAGLRPPGGAPEAGAHRPATPAGWGRPWTSCASPATAPRTPCPTSWRRCAPMPPSREIIGVMKNEFGIYQEPTWI